ncbi:MAG: homoserine kinase [Spirochaetes bacterium]|nr:homoserine kinase [Spirochaetota bacterium]
MDELQLSRVRAFAPATVANVACGFDIFGFAVDSPGDEATVYVDASVPAGEARIASVKGDGGRLPVEVSRNTAGVAVLALLEALKAADRPCRFGLSIELEKGMPLGSGLGSSAASAAAAVFAANRLLGEPFAEERLVAFAAEGERAACGSAHADNAGPALLGGFVLVRAYEPLDLVRIPVPTELWCALVHPHAEVSTKEARDALPAQYPRATLVAQSGNSAGLVAGLFASDYGLIGRSLVDLVAEPWRARLIPRYAQVKEAALVSGALGAGISGSGPSVFALVRGRDTAERCTQAMKAAVESGGLGCDARVSRIMGTGARVLTEE